MLLKNKVIFMTGGSRGIGKAIALRAARDGAKIVIAAKTADPHPKLPGTIYSAAKDIEAAGGEALPIVCDIRSEDQVRHAIQETVKKWGGIDIVVNNASAISLTDTEETSVKKYDLMNQINSRGTWMVTKLALPHLKKSNHARVLNLSPPLFMSPKWFSPHPAYTMAKYGMSLCVLGMAEEFKPDNIAVNALWPRTAIDTAAFQAIGLTETRKMRVPEIMADAAYVILCQDPSYTGNFCIDDDILKYQGLSDYDLSQKYARLPGTPTQELMPDLFYEDGYVFTQPPRRIPSLFSSPTRSKL